MGAVENSGDHSKVQGGKDWDETASTASQSSSCHVAESPRELHRISSLNGTRTSDGDRSGVASVNRPSSASLFTCAQKLRRESLGERAGKEISQYVRV